MNLHRHQTRIVVASKRFQLHYSLWVRLKMTLVQKMRAGHGVPCNPSTVREDSRCIHRLNRLPNALLNRWGTEGPDRINSRIWILAIQRCMRRKTIQRTPSNQTASDGVEWCVHFSGQKLSMLFLRVPLTATNIRPEWPAVPKRLQYRFRAAQGIE